MNGPQLSWSQGDRSRVVIACGTDGQARRSWLKRQLDAACDAGLRTSLFACDFAGGGPWAGVKELIAEIAPDLAARAPEILQRHDYELVSAVPALRRILKVRNPNLTDVALESERVRNYPSDRAFRVVHGLVEAVEEWKRHCEPRSWAIACDDFDLGGYMGRCFFRELMRRRGRSLELVLIAAVEPSAEQATAAYFAAAPALSTLFIAASRSPAAANGCLPKGAAAGATRGAAETQAAAEQLEREVGGNRIEIETRLPELIALWQRAGRPERAFRWQYEALAVNNSLGFYEDAVRYGDAALAGLKRYCPDDIDLHWKIFIKLFMCHVALGNPETAQRLAEEETPGRFTDPGCLCRLYYLISMLHARYLPKRDLARAEEYLELGLRELTRSQAPESEIHFQTVFNRNGLAMIRHFQGRYQEAIDLCQEGFERLQRFLRPGTHRLHRSVLLYNMAQVYSAISAYSQAIEHFSAAMELDPNYSEYYNERGNIYLRLGKYLDARADYLVAIDLSPPYREVWTNLGQCHRLLGELEPAVAAYTRALDLEPDQVLPLIGRAQAYGDLGQNDRALADYTAALILDPKLAPALANRAILYYEKGDFTESLADLNRAIELSPDEPDLYQNRAVLLATMGRPEAAARDLHTYLVQNPEADDLGEVQARLDALRAESSGPAMTPSATP